jgi:hypothetical protein
MKKILTAQDTMADARYMLECIFMAASTLSAEERDAMQTVAGEALKKAGKGSRFAGRVPRCRLDLNNAAQGPPGRPWRAFSFGHKAMRFTFPCGR